MKQKFLYLLMLVYLTALLAGCAAPETTPVPTTLVPEAAQPAAREKLILATTTSTEDSGLLDFILPDFEEEYNCDIDVIAVGTGQAVQLGVDGNADVLLVHDRTKEDKFMNDGDGVRREDVMYNDFIVIGPEDDPAGIKGLTSVVDVFRKIKESESPFVSRGDDSGTHSRELSFWKAAGIEPSGDWYISAGQSMGVVLTMADEMNAYTLSDRATYLARTLEGIKLVILTEGDPLMFNPYGVLAVDPSKSSNINDEMAQKFIDWIISVPVQTNIAEFGKDKFGQGLFVPNSTLWKNK